MYLEQVRVLWLFSRTSLYANFLSRNPKRTPSATSTASNGHPINDTGLPEGKFLVCSRAFKPLLCFPMQETWHFRSSLSCLQPFKINCAVCLLFVCIQIRIQATSFKATNGKVSSYLPPAQCLVQTGLYIALLQPGCSKVAGPEHPYEQQTAQVKQGHVTWQFLRQTSALHSSGNSACSKQRLGCCKRKRKKQENSICITNMR